MDLDAPYLSQDNFEDGLISENSQYNQNTYRKQSPTKITSGIGAGLKGSPNKIIQQKKQASTGIGYQKQG